MNADRLIARMESFAETLPRLVAGLTDDEARYKPPSGAWSILEIVCHLADEETDDFRVRLRMTQEDPAAPWPAADPERWAVERKYNEQNLQQALERFVRERRETIRWLRSLKSPDWEVTIMRPSRSVRAGELLTGWAAHDALHIRQIAKRLFELAERDGQPEGYGTGYAGQWGA